MRDFTGNAGGNKYKLKTPVPFTTVRRNWCPCKAARSIKAKRQRNPPKKRWKLATGGLVDERLISPRVVEGGLRRRLQAGNGRDLGDNS